MDAAQTPAAFLPFLAAHESVDLWFDDWSETRKRQMVADAHSLAPLKGTRDGAEAFLQYVDAELVDAVAYPAPFVMGRARIGRTPIAQPAFVAHYLLKIITYAPPRAFRMGGAALGRARLRTPSREPFNRALAALRIAKAPETEIRVDFAFVRRMTLADAIPLDGSHKLGDFVERTKL